MPSPILVQLIELSQLDSTIFRVLAEKKKLETGAVKKKQEYVAFSNQVQEKQKGFKSRKSQYQKEEQFLKEERDKIAERRKGLSTHNNSKVQQAAEKELDYSARQINLKEETLLATISELEKLEAENKKYLEELAAKRSELEKFLKEGQETMPSLEERIQRHTARRQELLRLVNPAFLAQYDRARTRYPMDPVVPLDAKGSCAGCFINVGPQLVQRIVKGETAERCPGCARIVYIPDDVESELLAGGLAN